MFSIRVRSLETSLAVTKSTRRVSMFFLGDGGLEPIITLLAKHDGSVATHELIP